MIKRICTARANGKEDFERMLALGYTGVIFFEPDESGVELANGLGLETYADSEKASVLFFDSVSEENIQKAQSSKAVFYLPDVAEYDEKILISRLPKDSGVLIPFESWQSVERENASVKAAFGAMAVSEPSDKLKEFILLAKNAGIKVFVQNFLSGKTDEMPVAVPALMQWMLRKQSCDTLDCDGFAESGADGFEESIVSQFVSRLYSTSDDPGLCLAKLAGEKYSKDGQKMIMAFKYASDGANFILPEPADVNGPFAFSAAYPLVEDEIYDFPFDKKDVTLEIDSLLRANENFIKAANTAAGIDKEIEGICRFISSTLETAINAKKWYRRLHAAKREKQNVRKKFLFEQMVNIAKRELENTQKCAEILFENPAVARKTFGISKIEAKIRLTEAAAQNLKIQIQQM